MNLSPSSVLAHAKSTEGRKQLRYAGVSVVFVPVGQILIQLLAAFAFEGGNRFTWASITAAAILTLPNFFANKYFVWKDTPKDNLRTQVIVFWLAAMLGVTFATTLTWLVEEYVVHDQDGLIENAAVFAAQLLGFGIVWIGRYLILDRFIFKVIHHGEEPDDDQLDMLHGDLPI